MASNQQDRDKIRSLFIDGNKSLSKQKIRQSVSGNAARILSCIEAMVLDGTLIRDESYLGATPYFHLPKRLTIVHEIDDDTLKKMLRDAYDAGAFALATEQDAINQITGENKPKFLRTKVR